MKVISLTRAPGQFVNVSIKEMTIGNDFRREGKKKKKEETEKIIRDEKERINRQGEIR